jgi:hypothetical protein
MVLAGNRNVVGNEEGNGRRSVNFLVLLGQGDANDGDWR